MQLLCALSVSASWCPCSVSAFLLFLRTVMDVNGPAVCLVLSFLVFTSHSFSFLSLILVFSCLSRSSSDVLPLPLERVVTELLNFCNRTTKFLIGCCVQSIYQKSSSGADLRPILQPSWSPFIFSLLRCVESYGTLYQSSSFSFINMGIESSLPV